MFLTAGGGFTWESLSLLKQLDRHWEYTFVVPESAVVAGSDLDRATSGSRCVILPEVSSRADHRIASIVRNLSRAVWLLWKEFTSNRPDVAVCLGSSLAIPIAFVCRLRGVPFIFVESITRTDALSSTGRLLLRLGMAEHFFVQWPELTQYHPRARFMGTVL